MTGKGTPLEDGKGEGGRKKEELKEKTFQQRPTKATNFNCLSSAVCKGTNKIYLSCSVVVGSRFGLLGA